MPASAARCSPPGCWRADAVDKALAALRRFRALVRHAAGRRSSGRSPPPPAATPSNGPAFIAEAERICGAKIDVLSGKREAELSALGVVSGIYRPDGIVGDLGGGSLELIDVHGHRIRRGVTLPLGGLALQDVSAKSLKKAREDRRGGARRRAVCSKAARAAPSTPSAAPGARWRGCTCGRPAIRCTSCTATRCRRSEALEFCQPGAAGRPRNAVADRGGRRCPPAAARPMPRWCSSISCGSRKPKRGRGLGARRARGPALLAARRRASARRTR